MQFKRSFMALTTFLLVLFTVKECHAELMCYVCDQCSSITADTPVVPCNADFFNTLGAGLPSTMTTTTSTSTSTSGATTEFAHADETSSSTPSTTTTPKTTRTTADASATTEGTTAFKESSTGTPIIRTTTPISTSPSTTMTTTTEGEKQSTTETMTTIPANTNSTSWPTVPLLEYLHPMMDPMLTSNMTIVALDEQPAAEDDEMRNTTTTTTTSYTNSSAFRVRQVRHAMPAESSAMTYSCYKVEVVSTNSTLSTRRGCARVPAMESICSQLKKTMGTATPINKCNHCSTDRCNGSSAMGVSVAAVIVGLVAALLKRN